MPPLGRAASSSTATTSPVPVGSGSSVTSCGVQAVDAVLGERAGERAQRGHEVAHEQGLLEPVGRAVVGLARARP